VSYPPGYPPTIPPFPPWVAPKRYLHISFSTFPLPDRTFEGVKEAMGTANDWLKYGPSSWIVYTGESPNDWYQKLLRIDGLRTVSFLIIEIDISVSKRSGQFERWVWDWFDKRRG